MVENASLDGIGRDWEPINTAKILGSPMYEVAHTPAASEGKGRGNGGRGNVFWEGHRI